ncbi:MAG TPA: hypothetical protein PK079_15415 [Leptospiraceae bacterium]|nr:hypothetical protein [Leptospiraceae bacterium]HMW06057.1 hypothetical protein [Leptospiraceae bacterium]HMX33927.1 hypothetical protein [Leptospiraceae bacterium]HMY31401.1 hypothetical protein [Leptospiraceae bacterium]HMZ64979.1 hypothetical protein [Leptospiraceae bacterium]
MLKVNVFFDEESIRKSIYDSLATELPKIEGEICNYDIKQIILDMAKKIIPYEIEWADAEKFGKNKMLIFHKNKVLQVDATELIESIRVLHQDYLEPQI